MNPLKVQVILGSTRQGRYGDKPAHWIVGLLNNTPGIVAELIDLRDWPLPFFDDPKPPARAQGHYASELTQRWAAKVADADAYVATVAEYNHGYTAVLKNALDALYVEWHRKPIGFVGYGGTGGARAVEQLRQVAVELQMAPIQAAVHLPLETFVATMKDPGNPELWKPVEARATAMIDQLKWWGQALRAARQPATV